MRTHVYIQRFKVSVLVLGFVVSGCFSVVGDTGAEVSEELIHAGEQAQEEIRDAIRKAERFADEGKYVEAFRLLFDTSYRERRIRLVLLMKDAGEFPLIVDETLIQTERQLIHEESSPLVQHFRNPDVPIQEKLAYLEELRRLAVKTEYEGEMVRLAGKYDGTLVQLATSPLLRSGEKFEVLRGIRVEIQNTYVSATQQERMSMEIVQLQKEADQLFQAGQYVEAFILLSEARQKARKINFVTVSRDDYPDLLKQSVRMRKEFVRTDTSSLIQKFKNRQIPTRARQILLYELRDLLIKRALPYADIIMVQGEDYDGTLVQILTHPEIDWVIKEFLLISRVVAQ